MIILSFIIICLNEFLISLSFTHTILSTNFFIYFNVIFQAKGAANPSEIVVLDDKDSKGKIGFLAIMKRLIDRSIQKQSPSE